VIDVSPVSHVPEWPLVGTGNASGHVPFLQPGSSGPDSRQDGPGHAPDAAMVRPRGWIGSCEPERDFPKAAADEVKERSGLSLWTPSFEMPDVLKATGITYPKGSVAT